MGMDSPAVFKNVFVSTIRKGIRAARAKRSFNARLMAGAVPSFVHIARNDEIADARFALVFAACSLAY
jgi:hypothetical protein